MRSLRFLLAAALPACIATQAASTTPVIVFATTRQPDVAIPGLSTIQSIAIVVAAVACCCYCIGALLLCRFCADGSGEKFSLSYRNADSDDTATETLYGKELARSDMVTPGYSSAVDFKQTIVYDMSLPVAPISDTGNYAQVPSQSEMSGDTTYGVFQANSIEPAMTEDMVPYGDLGDERFAKYQE